MNKKIKNFFSIFSKLSEKGLYLVHLLDKRSLWFGALLFFVIFGLVFSSRPALAQIPELGCGWGDVGCAAANFILSVMIKIVVLISFGIPLLISALFVGIVSLILGWIISPDFISLKFTQNPFVDIGLSITRNFANMGFIIFLVAIALATALRIREYKAKKTLPTLILVALLINFSPVFCGFIIDAANIVMNFFLTGITGLTGFINFLTSAGQSVWNLLISSGFDVWANIAAAMQIIIMIVFNFFAGFIFILFSALFIMRYIMLWILVILSPIAFVSYILPITRRGRSLLSWRTWWQQLVAWSIIGIIAAFFLYLGFTMISMINADPSSVVTYPNLSGLGLMNNILPYLIPLVLLWIAYDQTKKTSAMFAREIIEMPEKAAKAAVMTAAIAATAGAAGAAGGALKAMPAAIGKLGKKMQKYGTAHPGTLRGTLARGVGTAVTYPAEWGRRRIEWAEKKAEEHPRFAKMVKGAGKGLKAALWEHKKEEEGRELTPEEIESGYVIQEGKRGRKLTPKEMEKKRTIKIIIKPGVIIPTKEALKTVKEGVKTAWKDFIKKRGAVIPLKKERDIEKIENAIAKKEREEALTEDELRGLTETLRKIWEEQGREPTLRELREELNKIRKEVEQKRPSAPPPPTAPPEKKPKEEKPPEKKKKPKEKKPTGPPPEEIGETGMRKE
ncbi:hypothetical protein KJA16_01335 [Patescibacteria group bacterium]|nr:hypothetical protein [Patescibacteria group bacterium]